MPSHGHGQSGPPDTSKGYEQSDLELSGIVKGVVIYFIFTAAVGVAVLLGMWAFGQASPRPQDMGPTRIPPQPYPLLQNDVTAHTDIWNMRAREQFLLENTTYVDKAKGILRIPIEDAIDEAAAKGPKGADSALPGNASITQPASSTPPAPAAATPQGPRVIGSPQAPTMPSAGSQQVKGGG